MPALGVDHHRVDAHRVELPFPPHVGAVAALAPADAIRSRRAPWRSSLARERPRLLALLRKLFPCVGGNGRADADRKALAARLRLHEQAIDKSFKQSAAHMLGFGAQVTAPAL